MENDPWLRREHWVMMAKWLGVGTFISAAIISGIGFVNMTSAGNVTQLTALVAVAGFITLLLLAYARIYLPELFGTTAPPKDLFFLRGVSLFFGWLLGSAVGLAIVSLLG